MAILSGWKDPYKQVFKNKVVKLRWWLEINFTAHDSEYSRK